MTGAKRYIAKIYKGTVLSALSLLLQTTTVYASGEKSELPPERDAAKSLQSILKKASEQGLLQADKKSPAEVNNLTAENEKKAELSFLDGDINCRDTEVFDLSDYNELAGFDAVLKVKSSTLKLEKVEDVLPLAKTYLALGLGAEPASLANQFKTPKAYLLGAMSRMVDGEPNKTDHKIIEKYAPCSKVSEFWGRVATATRDGSHINYGPFQLSGNQLQILEDLPNDLEKVLTSRLGIYAAEQNAISLAEKLIIMLEPKAKIQSLPTDMSHERLYFYGLYRYAKGHDSAKQIFEYLSQYDGSYRTRALHRLVDANTKQGAELHESFSEDLLAIRQLYKGQTQGRQATVEIVRHQLKKDQYIASINLSKSEFSHQDVEHIEAVTIIGDRVHERLELDDKKAKLFALNGYMYDPEFFALHPRISYINDAAYTSALELELPNVALSITPLMTSNGGEASSRKVYAQAQQAFRSADYQAAIDLSKPFNKEDRFQNLILKSAMSLGDVKQAGAVLKDMPVDKTRHGYEANLAWRNGEWQEAKSALEAISKNGTNAKLDGQIAIADYVTSAALATPRTADDLDILNKKISGDIALVKAYLTDG